MPNNLNFETCGDLEIAQFVANNPDLFSEPVTSDKVQVLMAPSVELFRLPAGFAYVHRTQRSGLVLWYIYSSAPGTARALVQKIRGKYPHDKLSLLCRGDVRKAIFLRLGFALNSSEPNGDNTMTAPPLAQR